LKLNQVLNNTMNLIKLDNLNKKIILFIEDKKFKIKGPLGIIDMYFNFDFYNIDKSIIFVSKRNLKHLIKNIKRCIYSVCYGWLSEINLSGIGFKMFRFNDFIAFDLGYSSLFLYKNKSNSIKLKYEKTKMQIFGFDKNEIQNLISSFKRFYFKDKYQGKGIFFKNEIPLLKKKILHTEDIIQWGKEINRVWNKS